MLGGRVTLQTLASIKARWGIASRRSLCGSEPWQLRDGSRIQLRCEQHEKDGGQCGSDSRPGLVAREQRGQRKNGNQDKPNRQPSRKPEKGASL
jgi:hypothetical protein